MSILREDAISKGKFYYQESNKVRWEIITPESYVVVINGFKMSVKDKSKVKTYDTKTHKMFGKINEIMMATIKDLHNICDLADKYNALTMVDDCHATGFLGATGRGTHEYRDVVGRLDIITGTLGKALGGASGGFTSGRKEIVAWLRQRSRPYLFSNSVAPAIAATSIAVLDLLEANDELRTQLHRNARQFREGMSAAGFDLQPGEHPIIPVMLGDAVLASKMADKLLDHGVYVIGFSFPVVPEGQARIRTQMSAALTAKQIEHAIAAFTSVGRELGVIN
jgi:glycine C-acetyltransferase